MTRRLGLTGSIGMGKSTTAAALAERGLDVWDADDAVDRLYAKGGLAVPAIARLSQDFIVEGAVSRDRLKAAIAEDPAVLKRLEALVHPLVAADRADFLARSEAAGADWVVLDIPLLFETNAAETMDAVVVVSAPEALQRERVLARPGTTEEQFEFLLQKQIPDAEKRARADFVIDTTNFETAAADIDRLLEKLEAWNRA